MAGLAVLAWFAAATQACAEGGLDAKAFELYGGTYYSNCSDASSPRLTVFEKDFVLLDGDRRIAGSGAKLLAPKSKPAAGLKGKISTITPEGTAFTCAFFQDKIGDYLIIEGDAKTSAVIGQPLARAKFRRCTPTAQATGDAAAPVSPEASGPPPAQKVLPAGSELLEIPKFKAAYLKALGSRAKDPWLTTLDGPSSESRKVTVEGKEYLFANSCKAHDCYDHCIAILYSAATPVVYGRLYDTGKYVMVGIPPPAVAKELERLFEAEFGKRE